MGDVVTYWNTDAAWEHVQILSFMTFAQMLTALQIFTSTFDLIHDMNTIDLTNDSTASPLTVSSSETIISVNTEPITVTSDMNIDYADISLVKKYSILLFSLNVLLISFSLIILFS